MISFLLAAILFETSQFGIDFKVESKTKVIDPARLVYLTMEMKVPHDRKAELPDVLYFRDRVVGFSRVDDGASAQWNEKDGSTVLSMEWRLWPEPCADVYKIKPFVVKCSPKIWKAQSDEGKFSFIGGPIYFENPAAREPVTGGWELPDLKMDLELSWRLAGWVALAILVVLVIIAGLVVGGHYVARRVKEHRMSPIERAWVELDRLLKKNLLSIGRYKTFYVELTLVVRRYVERQHGVKAPHLTTEEFFEATRNAETFPKSTLDELIDFLRKSDMVKFAGVRATPETAASATESAKKYIAKDDEIVKRKTAQTRRVK